MASLLVRGRRERVALLVDRASQRQHSQRHHLACWTGLLILFLLPSGNANIGEVHTDSASACLNREPLVQIETFAGPDHTCHAQALHTSTWNAAAPACVFDNETATFFRVHLDERFCTARTLVTRIDYADEACTQLLAALRVPVNVCTGWVPATHGVRITCACQAPSSAVPAATLAWALIPTFALATAVVVYL
ncbi:uncharacterized protein MONBRDRAFT_12272 [Monosiga brevicollis MX1]|uniref:Uncharacterized protein n=1 Tax=Monosiga brevicollis TaxID=81824 RepID=A9VBR5_MONBE|nr:uncharacterized protein MONBRDRAFT_12272 [Monosiga brevicollis MX1]EDQ84979.1 predicted protein [Monosiga brevicollis MX1]|eukprot:XP_001750149.1 hypothetical protein [Monosiga brevicollis MX1]